MLERIFDIKIRAFFEKNVKIFGDIKNLPTFVSKYLHTHDGTSKYRNQTGTNQTGST